MEFDSCISTNKLRIFVGTWNVAGRSPVGSLDVDLDEWLNLKSSADIYVLGYVSRDCTIEDLNSNRSRESISCNKLEQSHRKDTIK
ncbi:type I inositol 145-trisphosphate 5-phosphatase CVP2-like protein [Trifolium pratense]|uniref:Type I inositol 145-trisphosphate 5-phosphatase CVP2-like protein n=1 Tax=Trifolium pratense TaxID=57577 RepID=A0A2K3L8J9_TRIPR|nr:type I inositol 145-trisphosphate 5-phosphatase CVP2-like protein [Trifolium pratense]